MTKRDREKDIRLKLQAKYGNEIRGLDNIAKEVGCHKDTLSRKLSSHEIELPVFTRIGKTKIVYTDDVAKYLAAS